MANKMIGFIGGGNMAQAIIGGLVSQNIPVQNIIVSEPNPTTQIKLQQLGVNVLDDNIALMQQADVVILAVKPQMAKQVLQPLAEFAKHGLIISIMAGIEIATLSTWLGGATRIVRVMPNTPALVQLGASGAFAYQLDEQDKQTATQILEAIGCVQWLENEQQLHAITAVSGSGPAYFFYLMEQMISAGVAMGLTQQDATQLVLQTAIGSAHMAVSSEYSPTQLRQNVTSPNGTTQAVIETFDLQGVGQGILQGMLAGQKRSQELAEQFKE